MGTAGAVAPGERAEAEREQHLTPRLGHPLLAIEDPGRDVEQDQSHDCDDGVVGGACPPDSEQRGHARDHEQACGEEVAARERRGQRRHGCGGRHRPRGSRGGRRWRGTAALAARHCTATLADVTEEARARVRSLILSGDNRLKQGGPVQARKARETYEKALAEAEAAGSPTMSSTGCSRSASRTCARSNTLSGSPDPTRPTWGLTPPGV